METLMGDYQKVVWAENATMYHRIGKLVEIFDKFGL